MKNLRIFTTSSLIALILFFSQVYPYIHFHHSHEDASFLQSIEVPQTDRKLYHAHHPNEHDEDSHEDSEGHQHHTDYSLHIDWHLVRTISSSQYIQIDNQFIPVKIEIVSDEQVEVFKESDDIIIPEQAVSLQVDSRAPPVSA